MVIPMQFKLPNKGSDDNRRPGVILPRRPALQGAATGGTDVGRWLASSSSCHPPLLAHPLTIM